MGQRGGSDVGDTLDLCDCGLSVANNTKWMAMNRHEISWVRLPGGKEDGAYQPQRRFLIQAHTTAQLDTCWFYLTLQWKCVHSTSPGPLDGELGKG